MGLSRDRSGRAREFLIAAASKSNVECGTERLSPGTLEPSVIFFGGTDDSTNKENPLCDRFE